MTTDAVEQRTEIDICRCGHGRGGHGRLSAVGYQLKALTGRELHLESSWYRFTVQALAQAPAPVESRELPGAPGIR